MRIMAGATLPRHEGNMHRSSFALAFQILVALEADSFFIVNQQRRFLGVVRLMAAQTPLRLNCGMRHLGSGKRVFDCGMAAQTEIVPTGLDQAFISRAVRIVAGNAVAVSECGMNPLQLQCIRKIGVTIKAEIS